MNTKLRQYRYKKFHDLGTKYHYNRVTQTMTQIKVRLLGAPRIDRAGVPVTLATRKCMALLANLALAGAPVRRERLMALLWPEVDQTHAQGDLRRALTTLRQALGNDDALESTRQTILLNQSQIWVDVREFRALITQHAETADDRRRTTDSSAPVVSGRSSVVDSARIAQLEEAVALWRDDFLAGFSLRDSAEFDDWQAREGERLRNELAMALQALTGLHSESGNPASAIAHTRRWLALDPLREDAHRALMQLYAQTGRRGEALQQYQACERILASELGVQPLEETTDLYHAIKDNQLSRPHPTSHATQGQPELSPPPALAFNKLPLVGREREWASMIGAQQTWQTQGYWIAIEGEPGIGKTRLLDDFAAHAAANGQRVLRARSYDGESALAHEPLIQVLRLVLQQPDLAHNLRNLPPHWLVELARLLPELGTGFNSTPFDGGARARLFEAIRQALLSIGSQGSLVLVFDDLHWADFSTIEVLIYLVRRMTDSGIALLTTWRNEESENTRHLRQALAETQRAGHALSLVPNRLSVDQVAQLCRFGANNTHMLEQRLFAESEGVPLIVVEYLQALAYQNTAHQNTAHGVATQNSIAESDGGAWSLPATVRGLLRARVDALGQIERQALQTAAVIGRSFDATLTQRASGRSEEEVALSLELLSARGIVHTTPTPTPQTPTYDFAHEKLRDIVYDDTNLARRVLLHQRVAQCIAADAIGTRTGELSGKAARHFEVAGKTREAATYYAAAGDHARRGFANAEALAHYRAALALGHPEEARIREAIGDLLTLRGDYALAIQSYRAAAVLFDHNTPQYAHLAHALANVFARLGEWNDAEAHFSSALKDDDTAAVQSHLLADWSRARHAQGDEDGARNLANRALTLAESTHDLRMLARAHNTLGILARHQHEFAQAKTHFERSLTLAEQLADPAAQVAALNNLALNDRDAGDIAAALGLTHKALQLCQTFGDRHHEAALRSNLADLLRAGDNYVEAMAQLKQSAMIFAEINADVRKLQPGVWKLTEW